MPLTAEACKFACVGVARARRVAEPESFGGRGEMQRLRLCGVIALLSATPAAATAAAGISDIAATRACWVRDPYALVQCQSEGGRYPARLVRARATTSDEDSFWSLFPAGYGGIVLLETVVEDIDRVAVGPDVLVARTRTGEFWVVPLGDPPREASRFASLGAANESLLRDGRSAVAEGEFETFEAVYRASQPPPSVVVRLALVGAVVVGPVLPVVVWRWRRRRRGG